MPEEKRRFSRICFNVGAELTVGATTMKTETIENLSAGGCLFPASGNIPIGSMCKVMILLNQAPDGPKVQVTGEVVRCEPGRIGIRFTGVDPDSLFHLHNILRYNASDPDLIEEEIKKRPGLV